MTPAWLRSGFVCILLVWMIGGPVYRQVFNGTHKAFPAWHMYRSFGTGLMAVELYVQRGDTRERIDRLAALGYGPKTRPPGSVRVIKSKAQLDRQVRQICEVLGDVDLRVEARIGRVRGWQTVSDGSMDACP